MRQVHPDNQEQRQHWPSSRQLRRTAGRRGRRRTSCLRELVENCNRLTYLNMLNEQQKYYLWLASRGSRTQLPIMPPSVAPNAFIPKSDAARQRRPLLLLLQPLRECMQSGLQPGRGQSGSTRLATEAEVGVECGCLE